ncbi:hypothetical protein IQ07DRAFT_512568, partial [Pyrenochaeta sp. DS3sAY3a]
HPQWLTMEYEDFLAGWILHSGRHSEPRSVFDLREMATRILQMIGNYEPL